MAEHNREKKRFPALCNQIKRQMIGVGQTRAVDPSCSREKTLLLFSIESPYGLPREPPPPRDFLRFCVKRNLATAATPE